MSIFLSNSWCIYIFYTESEMSRSQLYENYFKSYNEYKFDWRVSGKRWKWRRQRITAQLRVDRHTWFSPSPTFFQETIKNKVTGYVHNLELTMVTLDTESLASALCRQFVSLRLWRLSITFIVYSTEWTISSVLIKRKVVTITMPCIEYA